MSTNRIATVSSKSPAAFGVALLQDAVQEAAQQLCDSLDPLSFDGGECVRSAIKSAQPQITAAVARANANG